MENITRGLHLPKGGIFVCQFLHDKQSPILLKEENTSLQGRPIFLDHCDAALFETDGISWKGLLQPDVEKWKLVNVIRAWTE